MYFSVNPCGFDANLPRICILNGAISSFLLLLFFPFGFTRCCWKASQMMFIDPTQTKFTYSRDAFPFQLAATSSQFPALNPISLCFELYLFAIKFSLFSLLLVYKWCRRMRIWKNKNVKIKNKTVSQKSGMEQGKKTRRKNGNWIAIPPKRDVKPPKIDFLLSFASPFPSHDLISMWSTPFIGEC